MKRKKMLAVLTTSLLLTGMLAGCGSAEEQTTATTVNVWASGGENVRQTFEKLIDGFNEAKDIKGKYTAELHFVSAGEQEGLADQLIFAYESQAIDTQYDVVDLGDDDLTRMVALTDEDILMKLDLDKLPNAEGVTAQPVVAHGRVQPYRATTVMLAYDSEKMTEVPKTADELDAWIKAHPTRFTYNAPGRDSAGDSFIRTTIYNRIADEEALMSSDPKWEEKWDDGFAHLRALHPYLYQEGGKVTYPKDSEAALDLLAEGKIDACPAWADMALSRRKAGSLPERIKLAAIEPKFTGAAQGAAVPSFSGNKEGGTAFINYLLSPEAQTILVQDMAAIPLQKKDVDLTDVEELAQMDVSGFRTQALGTLVDDLNARWRAEIAGQ